MRKLPLFSTILGFTLSVCLYSCNQATVESGDDYEAIKGRDTAHLTLTRHGTRFFGKLIIRKPGAVVDSGEVRGKIDGNMLVGDYNYLPYGARHTKRRGFALKDSSGYLIRGYGKQEIYLGVPYYVEGSITFPKDGFIFHKKRLSAIE